MNYLNDNLQVLKQRNPAWNQFAAMVNPNGYHIRIAGNGEAYLFVERDGQTTIIENDRNPSGAIHEALTQTAQTEQPHLIILFGMGLGYAVFEVLKQHPECRVLVVEPDVNIAYRAFEVFDFRSCFNDVRVDFLIGVDPQDLKMAFVNYLRRNDHSDYLAGVRVICLKDNLGFGMPYFQHASEAFNSAVNYFWDVVVGNSVADGLLGLENAIDNIAYLDGQCGIRPYEGVFKGKLGIVVSSGPSLTNKLDMLRVLQDRAVIICADSALRILLKNGIKPFGVSCVERHALVPSLFEGFDIPKDIVLFGTPIVDRRVSANYPGVVCTVFPALKLFQWLPNLDPHLIPGASCSHFAYQLLQYFGCREVAVLGQDLAFSRDQKSTHVVGIADYASEDDAKQKRFEVPDNQGGRIVSHHWWNQFRNIFTDMIRYGTVPLRNVIEADQGAKINGAILTNPDDYFAMLKQEPSMVCAFNPDIGIEHLQQVLPKLEKLLQEKVNRAAHELSVFMTHFPALGASGNANEFFDRLKQAAMVFSEDTALLFWHLGSPEIKRFRAAARSLWTSYELREQLPLFIAKLERLVSGIKKAFDLEQLEQEAQQSERI